MHISFSSIKRDLLQIFIVNSCRRWTTRQKHVTMSEAVLLRINASAICGYYSTFLFGDSSHEVNTAHHESPSDLKRLTYSCISKQHEENLQSLKEGDPSVSRCFCISEETLRNHAEPQQIKMSINMTMRGKHDHLRFKRGTKPELGHHHRHWRADICVHHSTASYKS